MFMIAVFTLGCVDKNQAETTMETSTGSSAQTSEVTLTPAPGEDIFGTYSDLAAMDNMSQDMDMQIALLTEI